MAHSATLFIDKEFNHFEHLGLCAHGLACRDEVFPVDDHIRRAANFVVLHALLGLVDLGADRKRIKRCFEICSRDAVRLEQITNQLLVLEAIAFDVDRVKHRLVH